jgi:hypothetical protein
MGAQVGPHHRPNLLREHLFVLYLLTAACFAGPGEEVGFAAAGDGPARPSPTTTVTAANAAPTMAAVTRWQWPQIKSCWRLQELLARVLSAVGWGRSGSRWRNVSPLKFFLGRGRRGRAQGPSRSRCWWCSRWTRLDSLEASGVSGEVGLGSKIGGDSGSRRQTVKKALLLDFFGGLLRTYTDGIHFAQDDGNVFKHARCGA